MSPRSSGELIYSVIRFYSLNVFIIMLLQTILTQIFQLVDLNEDWKSRRKLSGGDVKVLRLWCLKPTFGFLLLPIMLRLRNSCVQWRPSWHTTQWEATVIFYSKSKAYMYVKILFFYRVNYGNANFWFGPLNCKIFGIMFVLSFFCLFFCLFLGWKLGLLPTTVENGSPQLFPSAHSTKPMTSDLLRPESRHCKASCCSKLLVRCSLSHRWRHTLSFVWFLKHNFSFSVCNTLCGLAGLHSVHILHPSVAIFFFVELHSEWFLQSAHRYCWLMLP